MRIEGHENHDQGGTDQERPPRAVLNLPGPDWRRVLQVTHAHAEPLEAAAGEEEASTGSGLDRRGRGLGRKRKAAAGDAAAPPPGLRQGGGGYAGQTGDGGRAAGGLSDADRGA